MTRFDSTQWSMVLRARGSNASARAALETLCRVYRPPVLAYIRGRGYSSDAADDLAQAFFARLLEEEYYAAADPSRGRFRAFLLTALKRFLINSDVHARTLKRGGGTRIERMDDGDSDVEYVSSDDGPERAFERSWAMTLLDAAMRRLRAEAEQAGRRAMFDELQEFLTEAPDEADYERAAVALGMRRNTLAVAVHRLRNRLRELVRAELLQTTAGREDLQSEMRVLHATLAGVMTPE